MLDIIFERFIQKRRTVAYPDAPPALPPRFRGRPFIDAALCLDISGDSGGRPQSAPRARQETACGRCAAVCPTGAINLEPGGPALDMGLCTFCGACARACPRSALVFTTDWRLASTEREALIVRPAAWTPAPESRDEAGGGAPQKAFGLHVVARQSFPELPERTFLLPALPLVECAEAGGAFRRSFRLRQVSAAGCGACEADLNVLGTIVFDLARFGMDYVASPRHADGLVLTGPVPRNMREALLKCHKAMAAPKTVLAVGACAISGGLFRAPSGEQSEQRCEGGPAHLPVDLYIPGCPPHPYTELDGLLRFIGRSVPGNGS